MTSQKISYKLGIQTWKVDKQMFAVEGCMSVYYTIQEVAEKTGKSQKTIRRHIAAKKLIASRIQNKWRIRPEDYDRWIESGDYEEDNDRYIVTAKIQDKIHAIIELY